MSAQNTLTAKDAKLWMDHCLKMQKALGSIHPSSYTQLRGYTGWAAAAKELGYIGKESVQQKDKSYRIQPVWKLENPTIKHAEKLLACYRERSSRINQERYLRNNPDAQIEEPADEDEPTNEAKMYSADEVSDIVEETVARVMQGLKAPAGSTAVDQIPEPEADALTGYEVTPADLLHEQQKTNALLSRLLRVWAK